MALLKFEVYYKEIKLGDYVILWLHELGRLFVGNVLIIINNYY